MAHARTIPEETSAGTSPSLLRLTVVALVLALAFDAVSTALAWDVVRALPTPSRHAPVRAVHAADARTPGADAPDGDTAAR